MYTRATYASIGSKGPKNKGLNFEKYPQTCDRKKEPKKRDSYLPEGERNLRVVSLLVPPVNYRICVAVYGFGRFHVTGSGVKRVIRNKAFPFCPKSREVPGDASNGV